ncbi:hypothetical protein [Haliangium ochraceum]|uniref:Uncharacterized protein n=1 Tax=Haliangium ochraceum (strain DSM 14365 / JCM 11303 / SMP-2) TaxID=502025 RepID=D0LGI1_HALO1|nr:hypothetical protein [Haliangium ochraceum]ACY12727.1 hypothetical protein Hoch_0086 [Haliangium ochraceum DSM 14365]
MKPRHVALTVLAIATLLALAVLFVKARAEPSIELPEDALAQARSAFQRAQSRSESMRTPRATPTRATPPPPPSAPADTDDEEGDPDAPQPLRPSVSQVRKRSTGRTAASDDPVREEREEIRSAYDTGDFATALALAEPLLQSHPDQAYIRRVAVVSACALGDTPTVERHNAELSRPDKRIVRRRCERLGFSF